MNPPMMRATDKVRKGGSTRLREVLVSVGPAGMLTIK